MNEYLTIIDLINHLNIAWKCMIIQVDHSIVESFVQGGRTCITSRVYPTKAIYGAARLFLFNNATEATVTSSLKIWQMNSAFIHPFRAK